MTGKELRLSRFIDGKETAILDISKSHIAEKYFTSALSKFSGILINLKQLINLYHLTGYKRTAGILLRINSIEEKITLQTGSKKETGKRKKETAISFEDALKTGVCACVTTFYLGYGDD